MEENERNSSRIIFSICKSLQVKWILTEKDLNFPNNTLNIIETVAVSWHPESKSPLTEVTFGRILTAFQGVHYRLIELTQFKGIYTATQFRLRHVIYLSDVWKKKQALNKMPSIRFIKKFYIDFLIRWVYLAFRFFDFSFWLLKMAGYLIYDIWLKTILIHWYLIVGEQADQAYRYRDEKKNADVESILETLDGLPEFLNPVVDPCPEEIREIVKNSRQRILFNWGSLVGLLCGLMFSFSAVFYRGATLALDSGEFYIRAILTLNYVLLYQTLIFGVILFLFSKMSLISVFFCWRTGWVAGLSGMLASFGWFSAMNLAHVSYVKAVGQIELLFAVGAGYFLFKEKLSSREMLGIFFIGLSIVLLIF